MEKISPSQLNSKQRESYNFHKVASVLADYGFASIRLSDDWQGADFIAQHIDGETFLKIQLKGRLTIDKKYIGKGVHICFPREGAWYLYPHDEVMNHLLETSNIQNTEAWRQGTYHFPVVSRRDLQFLEQYKL